jgi:glycogen(starch) synthase
MRQLLRIGLPTSSFLPSLGGAEVGLHNIAKRLAARGHRPFVFAPASNVRALRQSGTKLPYEVVSLPPKLMMLVERAPEVAMRVLELFFRWARWRYRIDVWHGTIGYPIGTGLGFFARNGDVPTLVRCAGEDIQIDRTVKYGLRQNPRVDAMMRRWLPQVPLLVAITQSVADEYRAIGISDNRIAHIPNGVDLSRFRNPARSRHEIRRKYEIPDGNFLFLCVGRNHPKKNMGGLIAGAKILAERTDLPPWTLLIAGRDVPKLQPMIEEADLQNKVVLIDEVGHLSSEDLPVQELVDLYAAADTFVFPSLIETFGIVIVEAMAASLPVITADAPGCRDIVVRGRYGLMVDPSDSAALADTMNRVLTDERERKRLVEMSRHRARDFDWDTIVDHYLNTYESLLSRAAKS